MDAAAIATVSCVFHPMVVELLEMAQKVDISLDQAYMPHEKTTLREAILHLHNNGEVLISGAKILCYGQSDLYLRRWGCKVVSLTYMEALALLRTNYPGPLTTSSEHRFSLPKKEAHMTLQDDELPTQPLPPEEVSSSQLLMEEDDRDTLPSPTDPVVSSGYGFRARVSEDTDIDDISQEDWEIVVLDGEDHGQYVGQTYIDGTRCNVWFNGSAFIAQSLTV